jgi:hypothetical protein
MAKIGHKQREAAAQQFGLANDRDLAGSTGRAGWARAGRRLGGFFIGRFLLDGV